MATATKSLDNKIIDYLRVLNTDEKKAVLSVVKTFAKEHEYELSSDEKKELDTLRKEHKAGKSRSYTMAEVRKHAYSKLKK